MRHGKMKNRGQTIILVAGITLGFLLIFAVLAIDYSRMYYVRGELQSAADSGALAGAKVLSSTGGTVASARTEAQKFAGLNKAAGQIVQTELNSGNDPNGDIVVGNWDPSLSPNFSETRTPVNAVKVVARRTDAPPQGGISVGSNPVRFLFPQLIPGLSTMGVVRQAIATNPPRAGQYISICNDSSLCASCTTPNICTFSPARIMDLQTSTPSSNRIAWTSLLTSPPDTNTFNGLICGNSPYESVCNQSVQNFTGVSNSTLGALESAMYDPNFDSSDKTIIGGVVQNWTTIVPVTRDCPPDSSAAMPIFGYARVRITKVCSSGGGNVPQCLPTHHAPSGVCAGGEKVVVIDQISCCDCSINDCFGLQGVRSFLVK